MLMWIAYAARPMTLAEPNTVSATSTTSTTLDSIKRGQSNNLKLELETRCGLLVEFRGGLAQDDCTAHLTHQSAEEFLTFTTEAMEGLQSSCFKAIHHSKFHIPSHISNSLLGSNYIIHLLFEDFRYINTRIRAEVDPKIYPCWDILS